MQATSNKVLLTLLSVCPRLHLPYNNKMQFGPLTSRQAINNRFKQLRSQSRQEILSQIYGKQNTPYNQSSVEQDLTQSFSALLNNYDFEKNNHIVTEIAQMFNLDLESLKKMAPQQRNTFVNQKILAKVEENIRIVERIAQGRDNNKSNRMKSVSQEDKHFEWLGVKSKYMQLRPIFQQILLEKVKLFDRQLTQLTQLPEELPYSTIDTTARQGFQSGKTEPIPRSKTVSTSLKHKQVQRDIQAEFTNVKIRDKSEFKLQKWTKNQQEEFQQKKSLFKSNLKINNIPVLFQFVKKYTQTVKARDNIYRKWQQRQKLGISPQELRYLCATSLFLNQTMAKSQKLRVKNNIKAAGSNLVSRLQLNIAQKIIQTYHQLMKKVSDLRAKYYEELTQERKLQQHQSDIVEESKGKKIKKQALFKKYQSMFTTVVNSEKMKLKLNPRIFTWVKHFINNLKKAIDHPLQRHKNPDVFKRLTTETNEQSLEYRHKMKYPSSKIIKREDQYSHRLKYRKYIPSERFFYDKKFQKTISNINKVRLNRSHSHNYYRQLTGGPKQRGQYISVDLSKKKVYLSSPALIKHIIRIQAKWKAVFMRKKYLSLIEEVREKQQQQFEAKLDSLFRIYPVDKKIDMKAIESRLKRISMKISNVIRPYQRVVRRPINVYTSFCANKLSNIQLKNKHARNGNIRIGQFSKLVEANHMHLLKKSGLVVTSKEINNQNMKNGTNAMWWAVYHSNVELATLFLQGGGDPNSRDNEGDTCLHIAVRNGAVPIIFLLLDYGADLRIKNNKKVNSLYYASSRMLKLLGLEQASFCGDRDTNASYFRRSTHTDVYKEHHY